MPGKGHCAISRETSQTNGTSLNEDERRYLTVWPDFASTQLGEFRGM